MKVFVTKSALTKGIEEIEVERTTVPTVVFAVGEQTRYFHGEGNHWHTELYSARIRAEQMRQNKIKSLKKLIAKLENLKF